MKTKVRLHAYIRPVVSSAALALMTFARGRLISSTALVDLRRYQVQPALVLPVSINLTVHAICWWDDLVFNCTGFHFTGCGYAALVSGCQPILFTVGYHGP